MSDNPKSGVVTEALQALRANPVVIGVLLLNVIFVAAGAWYLVSSEQGHAEHLRLILDRCLPGKS